MVHRSAHPSVVVRRFYTYNTLGIGLQSDNVTQSLFLQYVAKICAEILRRFRNGLAGREALEFIRIQCAIVKQPTACVYVVEITRRCSVTSQLDIPLVWLHVEVAVVDTRTELFFHLVL